MVGSEFLTALATIVVAAFVFTFVGGRFRIPTIVMYLVAGLVVGPATGLVATSESLETLSSVGIALMLFLVGLEMNVEKIRVLGKVGVLAGAAQVVVTFSAGFALAWALGFRAIEAGFLGVALTLSSTVVVIKLLDEKGATDAFHGRIAVGVLLVQDLFVIVLLTLLAGLGGGGELELANVLKGLGVAMGGLVVLMGAVFVAGKWVLPPLFASAGRSPQVLFIWSLAWCFLLVSAAHVFHLSHEVGAFLAGISLAQLPHNRDLHRRVHPLMNFFIAIFFVTLGVGMDLGDAVAQWPVALALSAFVLLLKPLIVAVIVRLLRFRRRTAVLAGVSLSQISEFSFLFLALALGAGLVTGELVALVGLVGLVTISVSSFAIEFDRVVASWVLRPFGGVDGDDDVQPLRRSGHVIIVGMNTLGRRLAADLHGRGEAVLGIDTDPRKLVGLPCDVLSGNAEYLSVLEEAGMRDAKLFVSALQIEDSNELFAYRAKAFGVPSSILAVDLHSAEGLVALDVDYLMIPRVDGVKMQNRKLIELGVLAGGEPTGGPGGAA
ncbi:MAG: cation:proton antiporter [Chthoniobacterales bacterium]